jgi:hypothetical protein
MIGPDGGTLDDGNGLRITVPAGALTGNVQISAARTNNPGPSGNGALSNLYQFGPDGTTFSQPVTVTLPLPASTPPNVNIFWSQSGSPSTYEDVNSTVSGSSITAAVTQFSTGFVGTLLSMANWVHIAPRSGPIGFPTTIGNTSRASQESTSRRPLETRLFHLPSSMVRWYRQRSTRRGLKSGSSSPTSPW